MKTWILGSLLASLGLLTTGFAQGSYDHEDPDLVKQVPSIGMVHARNLDWGFIKFKPATIKGMRVGDAVAVRRNDLIVVLGTVEAITASEVTVDLPDNFNPDGIPARIPNLRDEVIYYPLRLSSVSQITNKAGS